MRYEIVREQLTPPGEDRVVEVVKGTAKDADTAACVAATGEALIRTDVEHIAVRNMMATLVGQPAGTGDQYSPSSSMVRFVARPIKTPDPVAKARELGASQISRGINWTWANGFPTAKRGKEFVAWLDANGFENRGYYPAKQSVGLLDGVRFR